MESLDKKSESIIVGFPLYPGCTLLDFAGASQVFGMAEGFKVVWLAETCGSVMTTEGVEVHASCNFEDTQTLDVLFMPGGGGPGVSEMMLNQAMLDFVNRIAANPQTSWVGSVCTGAFILAAANLFKGAKVTTYWSQLDNLALFPELSVERDAYPRSVFDEKLKRFSGGGVSSSIDLALGLVERIKGRKLAEETQLKIQYAPNPPVSTGDPHQAKDSGCSNIIQPILEQQQAFIQTIRETVECILSARS
ncbi:DJ-1/PfpI family protein [Aliikangiella sp. G2MR2-5]|uniref:DJ-1/PfpI family protein n=1 Tax=Aliikangiella sp. G2MR2-5 TaxID=2788943 RepID=UPI0018AAD6AD|nr:DJ-1/PfpI family protein [Aliikangiella sp. G2MR2-5]